MPRILVIHFDAAEAPILAARIRRENFEADVYTGRGAAGFSAIRAAPPDAIVIDLTRMPSYGRAVGALLRESKSTRHIPLVFIEGDPAKTRLVKKLLPDAVFTNVLRLGPALEKAIRHAPAEPMAPVHARVHLLDKLRIGHGSTVAVLYAPDGFLEKLGPLPKDARFERNATDAATILLFVKSVATLGRELPTLARTMLRGRTLWIMWPKKASRVKSDLKAQTIVEMCSTLGLAAYKGCAIDETWSGMAVAPRRTGRRR
jgi:CheY-like chemotaxis protein